MNRLQFFVKTLTIYSVHSPSLYALCEGALRARLSRRARHHLHSRYSRVVYKLCCYSHAEPHKLAPGLTQIGDTNPIVVVDRPHSSTQNEARWRDLKADSRYRVAIDTYRYGLLLTDPRLHRQQLLLMI
ncbi:MAG: hypothetical protein IJ789_08090 [Bacteroidales bacterium]|nr:hypothetical protein [Bacteroidales bacterium]